MDVTHFIYIIFFCFKKTTFLLRVNALRAVRIARSEIIDLHKVYLTLTSEYTEKQKSDLHTNQKQLI